MTAENRPSDAVPENPDLTEEEKDVLDDAATGDVPNAYDGGFTGTESDEPAAPPSGWSTPVRATPTGPTTTPTPTPTTPPTRTTPAVRLPTTATPPDRRPHAHAAARP